MANYLDSFTRPTRYQHTTPDTGGDPYEYDVYHNDSLELSLPVKRPASTPEALFVAIQALYEDAIEDYDEIEAETPGCRMYQEKHGSTVVWRADSPYQATMNRLMGTGSPLGAQALALVQFHSDTAVRSPSVLAVELGTNSVEAYSECMRRNLTDKHAYVANRLVFARTHNIRSSRD